ncbi:MAG: magnesium transporter [Pseudomonadota bacterium]
MSITDALNAHYLEHHPAEAARFIELSPQSIPRLASLPAASLVELFDRLDPSRLRQIFLSLPLERQSEVLAGASIRCALTILRCLNEEERATVITQLPDLVRDELNSLLAFPQDTAGFYMDRPVAHFRLRMTVGQALDALRDSNQKGIRSLYVVDDEGRLAGRADIQDMALSSHDAPLATLVKAVEGVATLTSPRDELVDIFDRHRADSIPIVDIDAKLIGVVRYASLFQAAEDEATVDIQTMVGASADERALSTALFAVKKRLPWLHINLLTAFLAAAVVGLFESTIAQFTALAILLPVVAGQSGNAGSQALAVTMRGLALKEVNILQWKRVLAKEVKIGVIDGIALAFTCGLGVLVWSQSFGLALVIGIAMITSMIAAGIAGALVPMLLIRVGQDPATASSIILTTVTDVAGFMSFLGTATLLSFLL